MEHWQINSSLLPDQLEIILQLQLNLTFVI